MSKVLNEENKEQKMSNPPMKRGMTKQYLDKKSITYNAHNMSKIDQEMDEE